MIVFFWNIDPGAMFNLRFILATNTQKLVVQGGGGGGESNHVIWAYFCEGQKEPTIFEYA